MTYIPRGILGHRIHQTKVYKTFEAVEGIFNIS